MRFFFFLLKSPQKGIFGPHANNNAHQRNKVMHTLLLQQHVFSFSKWPGTDAAICWRASGLQSGGNSCHCRATRENTSNHQHLIYSDCCAITPLQHRAEPHELCSLKTIIITLHPVGRKAGVSFLSDSSTSCVEWALNSVCMWSRCVH